MDNLKDGLNVAWTCIGVGLFASIGWQLGKSMGRDIYNSCMWVVNKCAEKLDK